MLTAFDPYMMAGLVVCLLLMLCVHVLYLMRDTEWAPPHLVSRSVWCADKRRRAVVDFVERTQTGLMTRAVQSCSLRGAGEHCREECCRLLIEPRRASAAHS